MNDDKAGALAAYEKMVTLYEGYRTTHVDTQVGLMDDGESIWDSSGTCEYLVRTEGDAKPLPEGVETAQFTGVTHEVASAVVDVEQVSLGTADGDVSIVDANVATDVNIQTGIIRLSDVLIVAVAVLVVSVGAVFGAGVLGALASSISFALFLPQAMKTWRTRNNPAALSGVSVGTQVLLLANASLWGLYGWETGAFWVAAPGLVNAPLALLVIGLILRARRTSTRAGKLEQRSNVKTKALRVKKSQKAHQPV